MKHVRIAGVAGRQFNRISSRQLRELGLTKRSIAHEISVGRLVEVERGVFAVAPVLEHDDWGRWMGATLTAPNTYLSHASAAACRGFWSRPREFETVVRHGSGGPRRHGGVLAFHSIVLDGDTAEYEGVPMTTVPRTLLDLAGQRSMTDRALARAVRDAVRLDLTNLWELGDVLGRHRGRRGCGRLGVVLQRYSGLPLRHARSGAEVRAMEILRDAGRRPLPLLNAKRAGIEADLSWTRDRLIVEIDGGPFHQDKGEDARKEAAWRAAGWTVRRIDADAVHAFPERLLALSPA